MQAAISLSNVYRFEGDECKTNINIRHAHNLKPLIKLKKLKQPNGKVVQPSHHNISALHEKDHKM